MNLPLAIIWHSAFFWLFAFVACAFAAAVVFTNNIVRMAFYLTLALGATAGLFFLAGSEFVGAMQLMIYVGGTLVLLIFGVMLTAQSRFVTMKTSSGEWILSALVGGSLLVLLLQAAFSVERWNPGEKQRAALVAARAEMDPAASKDTIRVGMALVGPRVDAPGQVGQPSYFLLFELASVHLLVVLVGAAYLARTKRRAAPELVSPVVARAPRKHRLPVLAWLTLGIVGNALAALHGFTGFPPLPPAVQSHLVNLKEWLLPALAVGFVVNVLFLLVVGSWQKWGVIGLVAVALVQCVFVQQAGLPWVCVLAFAAGAVAPIVVLFGLLKVAGTRGSWAQMD